MRTWTILRWLKRVYVGVSIVFTTLCLIGFAGGLSLFLLVPEKFPPQIVFKADALKSAASDWKRWTLGTPGQRTAHFPPIEQWQGQGAHAVKLPASPGRVVPVASPPTLLAAIKNAMPGDIIRLAPGTYRLQGRNIAVKNAGLPGKPITVEAGRLGEVTIELDMLEGFWISAPYWTFQNLKVRGVCADDSACEHAFHVVGDGHHVIIRNNRIQDFNASIKANGTPVGAGRAFPDHGLVENNSFYASRPRDTANPVTSLDMVGVNEWIVRGNLIADFVKKGGDQTSYGAFFKGGGRKNTMERNLVICAMHLPQKAGARVGLSLGGGGTDASSCRTTPCAAEHAEGVIRYNLILHCSDVGIYLNRAASTSIYNNTLYDTLGIDVRFGESFAMLANNLLDNRIATRDGGSMQQIKNTVASQREFSQWFNDADAADFSLSGRSELPRGNPLRAGETDFCGHAINSEPLAGAVQTSPTPCRPLQMIPARDKNGKTD